jgi:very-long-chain enoyl-CoA reductase
VNHPLYTPPAFGSTQIGLGLFGFMVLIPFVSHPLLTYISVFLVLLQICEYGNFAIHSHLRDLRPPGSTERQIPFPSSNPFTWLFNYVSCPNYTYEFGAWLSFTGMTQTLTAGIFTLAGLYQMTAWAIGKHKNYKREFSEYPGKRKTILPFVI